MSEKNKVSKKIETLGLSEEITNAPLDDIIDKDFLKEFSDLSPIATVFQNSNREESNFVIFSHDSDKKKESKTLSIIPAGKNSKNIQGLLVKLTAFFKRINEK